MTTTSHDDLIDPADPIYCEWFALCTNEATYLEPHPILGHVPICDRCLTKINNWR